MAKISASLVSKAKHDPDKDVFYWDSEIKGFGLKVARSGATTFVYQYRTATGQSKRISLGRCSEYKAEEARKKARDMRHTVDGGGDPVAIKEEARNAQTVSEMLNEYMESAKFAERTESTKYADRLRIERHLKPTIGKRMLLDLTTENVRHCFAAIRDGKTAAQAKRSEAGSLVRGGEGAARMSVRSLRAALNWAIESGKLSKNVAIAVNVGSDTIRETIIDGDEYKKIFETIEQMEVDRNLPSHVADAIRVIAVTGARRGEIAGLTWDSVKEGKLVIQKHKTRAKTGKPRIISLPTTAQVIVARQNRSEKHDYVFAPKGYIPDLSRYWKKIRKKAGVNPKITIHSMRHSLASGMAMQGFSAAEIMNTLGHSQLATSQKYIHWSEQEQAKLADRASASIAAAMEGKPTANVVKLRTVK
jgi:integrase